MLFPSFPLSGHLGSHYYRLLGFLYNFKAIFYTPGDLSLLEKDAIKPVPQQHLETGFLFYVIVHKKSRSLWPIMDLRGLGKYMIYHKF